MRRALSKALWTRPQCSVRGLRAIRSSSASSAFRLAGTHVSAGRRLSSSSRPPRPQQARGHPLGSSMIYLRATVALVSALVGYGAYYSYKDGNVSDVAGALSRGYSSSAHNGADSGSDQLPGRPVLVVGADELHTATYVGEGPISKNTDDEGRKVLEMLTPEQATSKLRKSEQSYLVNRGQGVVRYDLVQLPSNDPIEDDHAERILEVPSKADADKSTSDWMFWGVFDGHSGWTTSAKLRQTLINFVARELNETYVAANGQTPADDAVDRAIKDGFIRLDDEICHQSVQKVLESNSQRLAAEMLAPALSGSCALLSFYDSKSKLLRVACTGDSRAVLGRRSASGKWTATPLSVDQTGSNPDEAARLRKAHPGEDRVVYKGRVLGGLEPTRAFGDASYKWSKEMSERLKRRFFGRNVSPELRTPPYVTAEPVVTTTRVEPEKGDFLVMATDGLWEMLTNEEVVGLVGKWIETQASSGDRGGANGGLEAVWSRMFGSAPKGLPVEADTKEGAKGRGHGYADGEGQKMPVRQQQWGMTSDSDRFVVRDKNVATHLVRNALGGKNEDQVSALLTLPAPYARRYRDDLTVQVVFFGNGDASMQTGQVVVNREATAKSGVKAKL